MTRLQIALGVALNAVDLFVALFLIFGGRFIAVERSVTTGYVSVGVGLVLLYLSTGMWTKAKWKLLTRLALYAGTLCVVLVTLVSFLVGKHETLSEQTPLPAISVFLAATVAFSVIHLVIRRRAKLGASASVSNR